MPAQPEAAGDQITGGSPLTSGLGHPSGISSAARPDDTLRGRTKMHVPSTSASLSLNSSASVVSRAIFSLLTAMSTTMQSPGSASCRSPPAASSSSSPHAAASPAASRRTAARRPWRCRRGVMVIGALRSSGVTSYRVVPIGPQGEHRRRARHRCGRRRRIVPSGGAQLFGESPARSPGAAAPPGTASTACNHISGAG